MQSFSVRPDWKSRGYRCRARDWRHALDKAIMHWSRDKALNLYAFSTDTGFSRHPWGVRLERAQQCVDIVRVAP